MNFDKLDIDEMIEDPSYIFDQYTYNKQKHLEAIGLDFSQRFKFNKISSIYNLQSTIYEMNPTADVALLKTCKHYADLALPILSKIKNKELILSEYKLEHGHFIAL